MEHYSLTLLKCIFLNSFVLKNYSGSAEGRLAYIQLVFNRISFVLRFSCKAYDGKNREGIRSQDSYLSNQHSLNFVLKCESELLLCRRLLVSW